MPLARNCLSVFDHFVGLGPNALIIISYHSWLSQSLFQYKLLSLQSLKDLPLTLNFHILRGLHFREGVSFFHNKTCLLIFKLKGFYTLKKVRRVFCVTKYPVIIFDLKGFYIETNKILLIDFIKNKILFHLACLSKLTITYLLIATETLKRYSVKQAPNF